MKTKNIVCIELTRQKIISIDKFRMKVLTFYVKLLSQFPGDQ